jgi:predicted RNase H-like nuclease
MIRSIAGADGCTAGWVVVSKDLGTGVVSWRFAESAEAMALAEPRPEILAVDILIALLESGARPCDVMARKRLGTVRGSSVFPAPVRPVLAATSCTQACRIRQDADGKKMSKQAWAIVAKVREVDSLLQKRPELRADSTGLPVEING